jgi:hypothetical protein
VRARRGGRSHEEEEKGVRAERMARGGGEGEGV